MLVAFLLLAIPQIPIGAYAMPEFCNRLTALTGVSHSTDVNLRDYPVFVSVKSGDPERIRKLVATAFHATWQKDGEKLRLVMSKVDVKEGYEEFVKQFKEATKDKPLFASIPPEDLFKLVPGDVLRYANLSGGAIKPLTAQMAKAFKPRFEGQDEVPHIKLRRVAPGIFESYLGEPGIEFITLPAEIKPFLGASASKVAVNAEDSAKINGLLHDPKVGQRDMKDLAKRDPVATFSDLPLTRAANAIDKDLVMALPDSTLFSQYVAQTGGRTVEAVLGPYSMALGWVVEDGALIGRLSTSELLNATQAKRSVVARLVERLGEGSVANIAVLGDYVNAQRPVCSNAWTDVLLLVLAGIAVDQEYLADYPFNIRLHASFDPNDWKYLQSGEPFSAGRLSQGAQRSLRALLLLSRRCQERDKPDPAFWPTVAPSELMMRAELTEEQVLVHTDTIGGAIDTVEQSAANYEMRKKEINREPIYQVAKRTKIKLSVHRLGASEPSETIETGFSEVTPDKNIKPCHWTKLPPDMMKVFQSSLKRFAPPDSNGVPPPKKS
jgi:hypothetical protein